MKQPKKLSWKPVRRGRIYCAPACGGRCTHADCLAAHREAKALVARMKSRGWKIRVWENIGWHWCIYHGEGHLSISPSYDGKKLHIMFSLCMPLAGTPGLSVDTYSTDPNKLVVLQKRAAEKYLASVQKLINQIP